MCEMRGKGGTFLDLALMWTHCVTSGNSHVLLKTKVSSSVMRRILSSGLPSDGVRFSFICSCAHLLSKYLSSEVLKEVIKGQVKYQQPCSC